MTSVSAPRSRSIVLSIAILVVALVVDQASKLWVLKVSGLAGGGSISLLPVLDLVLVWNRGISYGLFQQDDPRTLGAGRLHRGGGRGARRVDAAPPSRVAALSLALIVGGAIGNLIDRVVYGAVVDFVYFHIGSFSWYVFNLADAWIVAGVAGLLYDSFRPSHTDALKAD